MTGLQWIASESWIAVTVFQTPHLMPYLAGILGIAIHRGEIPGLREFLLQIRPDLHHNNSYGNNIVRVPPNLMTNSRNNTVCLFLSTHFFMHFR